MNKTIPMMNDCVNLLSELRSRYYGKTAKAKDFKDSHIVNCVISEFDSHPSQLMTEAITEIEESAPKIAKSINFRADNWEKLSTFAGILGITPMEVCRRLILYTVINGKTNSSIIKDNENLSMLKSKLSLLEMQIHACMTTLAEIVQEITKLEGGD